LDPSYDLTRIAQPYLKELVDLRDGNAYISVLNSWAKRLGWRREDIFSLVQSPRRVAHIDDVTKRLEQGDLKLQVLELLLYKLRDFSLIFCCVGRTVWHCVELRNMTE
jgi:hypothetical protein